MADYFVWDESVFSIHVSEMDDQHKILIALMNELHEAHERNDGFEQQLQILDSLAKFTQKHFDEEEAYMEKIGFDGLKNHKIIHQDLLQKFGEHIETAKKDRNFSDGFFNFLRFWLQAHICGIDAKYGEFANKPAA